MAFYNQGSAPLVSIITPSFNQGRFIETALLSVKLQKYKNIEHIIIDGGSCDETLDILKSMNDGSYNMRWISEPDSGMYDAINKGILLAKGDIIAYLNCDDFYLPWSVEVAVESLKTNCIVFGDMLRYDIAKNNISPLFSIPFNKNYYNSFGFISQPTVFLRREVIEKVGYFDNSRFNLIADCDYWLRCAQKNMIPKKVWEFLAVECEHDMTQRISKNAQLQDEFARLRSKYARRNNIIYNIYRVINNIYWRIMMIEYKLDFNVKRWNNMHKSMLFQFEWYDVFEEFKGKYRTKFRDNDSMIYWMKNFLSG